MNDYANVVRRDFPILAQTINGYPLIYLDNASTTQKPTAVIEAITRFYSTYNANVGRGLYPFAEQATHEYELVRAQVARFINALPQEISFTSGTTESINRIALTWALKHCHSGDTIVVSELEHHANLLAWQQVCARTGAQLQFIPVNEHGLLVLDRLEQIIGPRTKLVCVSHVSNVLGTTNPIERISAAAHSVGARILVDAAQSAGHLPIDVKVLDVDFLAFSAHKMLGPTGVGVLYVKQELLDELEPLYVGGGMVFSADYQQASWLKAPQKFQAGTPNIAGIIGFGAALSYIEKKIPFSWLAQHEAALCTHLINRLCEIKSIKVLGPIEQLKSQGHLVSFTIEHMHAHDVAAALAAQGICVRAGHHCAQPLAQRLGIELSVRISFYAYNTIGEVDAFINALTRLLATS